MGRDIVKCLEDWAGSVFERTTIPIRRRFDPVIDWEPPERSKMKGVGIGIWK